MIAAIDQGISQAVTSIRASYKRGDFTLKVARAAGAASQELSRLAIDLNGVVQRFQL